MLDLIALDYLKTKQCDFSIAKDLFFGFETSFIVLRKNSPFTQSFTKGYLIVKQNKKSGPNSLTLWSFRLMNFEETGLRDYWRKREANNPKRCLDLAKERLKAADFITLTHLTGAFLILAAGYGFSIFSFVFSLFYCWLFP